MGLADKVCLVTGGSKGIGKEICLQLAKEKACVIVNYLSDENKAAQVVSEIEAMGRKAMMYKADVSNFDAVSKMVDDIVDKFGRIDVLVNNAGITKDGLIVRMKEEDWDRVIDINLKGIFNTSKACVKYMIKQKRAE